CERGSEAIGIGRVEIVKVIRNGLAVALAINAGERGDDVVGSVRDERSVVIAGESAVIHEKVEEMRHLLEVGGNVRVIASEVNVVELNVNDVLDFAMSGVQRALATRRRLRLRQGGGALGLGRRGGGAHL